MGLGEVADRGVDAARFERHAGDGERGLHRGQRAEHHRLVQIAEVADAKGLAAEIAESGAEHPPLLTVDQEGGKVQRLARNVGLSRIPSAKTVASRRTTVEARRLYAGVARSLRKLGFNTNFGPVVDANTNGSNPIIGKLGLSFSPDPKRVVKYAREFVPAHRRDGDITAQKHFPAHGSSRKASHLGFVDI